MTDSSEYSQESDILPLEFKHLVTSASYADIISAVENEEPFGSIHSGIDENHSVLGGEPLLQEEQPSFQMVAPIQLMPSPTCAMPATDEYPGPLGFEIQVDGGSSGKQWVFSYELYKLFINMNTTIHLGFKCEQFRSGLYVRALPVYCESEAFQVPVDRCIVHRCPGFHQNTGFCGDLLLHVLRIDHLGAIYEYDETSERRSVRVALDHPQAGTDWVTVAFKFMCKNSCIAGMNRRPIEVIFTLEDSRQAVLGRRKMKVRICSCPKRDKSKEEEDVKSKHDNTIPQGKRAAAPETEDDDPSSKLRKVDDYKLQLLDEEAFADVTDYARSRLLRKLRIENREATEDEKTFLQYYEDILNAVEQ